MSQKREYKDFRDPIHGFIRVYEEELEIISSPIFQRLRGIKQLSFAYTVYHGAEHSRFGHCLGVMHIVDKALNNIKKNAEIIGENIETNSQDIRLARFAALLHDVGHFPFSHASDKLIPDKHEEYSTSLIQNVFASSIKKAEVEPDDVCKLIKGKPPLDKPYLGSLINSQLDADKFDYLLRDSHYSGVKYGIFDLDRLLDSLSVVDNELLVLDSGYYAAEQLIISRYHMFEQLYNHHTKRAFEEMTKKVATYMINNNEICYPKADELKDQKIQNNFISYNDSWFIEKIKNVNEDKLKILAKSIGDRIPYRVIIDSGQIWKKINESDPAAGRGIVRAIEADIEHSFESLEIDESEIIFDQFSSIPYKLKPYTSNSKSDTDDPDIVYIYDNKIKVKRPIEITSPIVSVLASNSFTTRRVYVKTDKYPILKQFLNKYDRFFTNK